MSAAAGLRGVLLRRTPAVLAAVAVAAASWTVAGVSPAGAEGFGDGLVGGPEVDGDGDGGFPPLGPAGDEGSGVGDVLGDDGVYSWDDGGRVIGVRRVQGVPDGVGVGGAPGGGFGGGGNATAGEWFVTDTGQLLQLHGGVIVMFRPGTTAAEAGEVLGRHGLSWADAAPVGGLDGGFVVSASPQESLVLAAGLAAEPEVLAASPNWNSPNTVEQLGDSSPSGSTLPFDEAPGGGGSEAQGLSDAQRRYCTGYAAREDWAYCRT